MLNFWLLWFLFRKKPDHSKQPFSGAELGAMVIIIALAAVFLTTITSPAIGFAAGMVGLILLFALF